MFRARDALNRRLLSPAGLRSAAWQRLLRGVYADSRLERDHLLQCRAAVLLAPAEAAVGGPSAAFLHGVESAARPDDPVHLLVDPKRRFGPVQGLKIHTGALPEGDVTTCQDIRCTTAARTAWDVAMWRDLIGAVPTLDVMLRTGLVAAADLATLVERRRTEGVRGARRVARTFGLADGRAQSPPESAIRIRLILRGLPPPVPQYPVTVRSGRVLHPDLAWPEYRVALEYDGAHHADPDQMRLDRQRLNAFTAAGWLVMHATARHLGSGFPGLVQEVREALRSRGALV